VGATLLVYWGALGGPFQYDDYLFLQSSRVTNPEGLFATFSPTQLRQLTYLTFHLNHRFGGADPAGYHLVNVLVHAFNVLLLGLCLHMFADRHRLPRWLPAAGAAIFALHPVQSEPVNYIYQRSTLLAATFVLLALALLLQSMQSRRRIPLFVLAAAAYALAIACKESAVVLPVVCAVYVWAFRNSGAAVIDEPRRRKAALALLLAATLPAGWALWNLYRAGEETVGLHRWARIPDYLMSQFQVFASYLRLIIWPSGLTIEHDFRPLAHTSLYGMACVALAALCVAALLWTRSRNPAAAFLGAAFLIFLAPTSTLIPSADLMFEHRLYLPMLAGSPLLAWAVLRAGACAAPNPRVRPAVQASLLLILVAAYGFLSLQRVHVWADDVRLWQEAVARAPESTRAHYNLGVALMDVDREKSRAAFLKALQFQPEHAAALYNLGWIEQAGGRLEPARRYYDTAIRADASFWKAHHSLANLAVLRGAFQEARIHYEAAIRLNPGYWPPYESLAAVLVRLGDTGSALEMLEKARQQDTLRLQADDLISRIRAAPPSKP
jgi:tetratricopeptide (TPR) repeat protein